MFYIKYKYCWTGFKNTKTQTVYSSQETCKIYEKQKMNSKIDRESVRNETTNKITTNHV